MSKYILNNTMAGYEKVKLSDKTEYLPGDTMVIYSTPDLITSTDSFPVLYQFIRELLVKGISVVYIGVYGTAEAGGYTKSQSFLNIEKLLMMLLISYNDYQIYMIESDDLFTSDYMISVENHEPNMLEVRQYIGSDVGAYTELTKVLIELSDIENLNKSPEQLVEYIKTNKEQFEQSAQLVEFLKSCITMAGLDEANNTIQMLQSDITEITTKLEQTTSMLAAKSTDLENYANELATKDKRVKEQLKRIEELENKANTGSSIGGSSTSLVTYNETDIRNFGGSKVKHVVYFKEISYTPYANTFVNTMLHVLRSRKSAQLLIFDTQVGLGKYYGLRVVNNQEYVAEKASILKNITSIVSSAPNPPLLKDLFLRDPAYDVLIIYDRLHMPRDIVTGMIVHKIYVCNSSSDFTNAKGLLKIAKNSYVFCSPTSKLKTNKDVRSICIPFDEAFAASSEPARNKMYTHKLGSTRGQYGALIEVMEEFNLLG